MPIYLNLRTENEPKAKTTDTKTSTFALLMFISIFLAYIIIWSIISLDRYYSLHAQVMDLGINMYRGWVLYHNSWGFVTYIETFSQSPFVFILSPLMLLDSYPLILIIQTMALALPSIFIFLISRQLKIKSLFSATIASMYLLYFPLAGINYTDFHYQAFFILFFIVGYFFQIKKMTKSSLIFFVLAATVRFPYAAFVLIYAILGLFDNRFNKLRRGNENLSKFYFFLIGSSAFLLALFIITSYFQPQQFSTNFNLGSNGFSFDLNRAELSLFTYFIILTPFLFSPLRQPKWLILLLPSFFLTLLSSYPGYVFEHFLNSQYDSSFIPFVLLSYIELISSIEKKRRSSNGTLTSNRFHKKSHLIHYNLNNAKKLINTRGVLVTSIVLLLLLGLYFQPLGPLNSYDQAGFYIRNNTDNFNPNMSQYNGLVYAISLIKENDYNNTLIQGNMPEFLPRTISAPGALITAYSIFNGTISNQSISTNRFPVFLGNGWHNVSIDFLIAQPGSYFFYIGRPTMDQYYTSLLLSGYYGILVNVNGTVILERGYNGHSIK